MDYATVVGAFFAPETADHPEPDIVVQAAPARRLRDAFEPVAMHAVWSPVVHERLAARGLDFFMTYAWGRACVLGEPSPAVVASAFGAFEPAMIGGVYENARRAIGRDEVLRITVDATAESLRRVIGETEADIEAVRAVGDRLARVVDSLDPTGRPLFSGVQALLWPEDPFGALWHACLALREHRGDGHIATYIGAGFDPVQMNVLTELWLGYPLGEYSGTRAWSEERTAEALEALRSAGLIDGDALTAKGAEVRADLEHRTDTAEQHVVDALGGDLDSLAAQLTEWSRRCIDAGTFPPDPRKRAAG